MEGDGMVAIVQGLKDAGLAVTLMNKTHLQNSLTPNPVPQPSQSSVETNTHVERIGRAAQVRDDHYTSSYQLAHCNIRPSSPPERLPEFPPQRAEPSRSTVSGRLSPTSLPSQNTDPFVHSLRRYPLPISPERSVSTELVQRLLSYTQNKHLSKNTNIKSIKLLRDESPTRDQKTNSTSTKNIQTYTRIRAKDTKDCGANTNNDLRFSFGKKGRSFASSSPYNLRARSDHHNDSYDYLKAPSRRGCHTEVRYLKDVKKCIRDTIKQLYDEKPLVCPQIKSRFNQHKKEHHRNSQGASPDVECDEEQASASTSIQAPLFASCQAPIATPQTCPVHKVCCDCKEPIPCSCTPVPTQASTLAVPPEPEHHEATDDRTAVCTCKADATKPDRIEPTNNITDIIYKWLKDLPVYADDTPENKSKREDMIRDLGDKLKSLEGDRNYGEKAMKEIKKCIDKLPMWYPEAKRDQDLFKNQIADDLFNRLIDVEYEGAGEVHVVSTDDVLRDSAIDSAVTTDKRRSTDSVDEELERKIMDWLEDIPELSSDNKDNKMMAKSLAKKLKKVQKQDLGEEQNQEQMKEEVVDWIDSILKSKGEKLDSKTKTKLSNKLLDKLTSAAKFESKMELDRKSSIGEQNDYEDLVWEWLDDVVSIPEQDKKTHKKFVKNFAEKLQQLKSENASDEVVEKEIVDFLGALSKKGVAVSSKNKDKLADKLMSNIKAEIETRKSFSPDEDLQQSILGEISELIDDIPSNISKNKRKNIKDKVVDILAKNINNLSEKTDNINRGIVSILKKEAKMPENEATNLASALINRVKGMPLPDQSKPSVFRQSIKLDDELKQLVSEEVSDILNDYNISAKKRQEVEKSITEVLADQIVRGTDNKQAKNDIISILQNANVSEDDALDISNRLLEISKELSLSYKTQDSKLGIDKFKLSRASSTDRSIDGDIISPMERAAFEEKAEREVLDFIEDVTGDDSPKTRKKRKEAAGKLFHKLGEIMSDPDETHKDERIIEELLKYLRKLSIDSDMPREEMARKLANQLQGIGFASTPKKGGYSFYPQRGSMDISSIHIDDADSQRFKKPAQIIATEETKYVKKLTELIQSWIDELSIDLTATEDKVFKETMIQDLASDIIDRQKYLQLNPDAKTSDQEELEHLKYEVFRWLNKLLDIVDLSSVMQKTATLMRKIKDVSVPVLVKPTRERTESKSGKELISDSMDSIKEKISMCMEDILRKLDTSTDINFQKKMINELAEKIQQFRANNQTENIHNEISNWLSKLIKDLDTQLLTKMTEALEARLKQRDFTEASFVLSQDSSQFVEENLIGGIQNWFKNLPLYQKLNSTEKRELESLIPELVMGLKSVYVSGQDTGEADKLLDEIVKHLKKFPMDAEHKSDTEFLQRTAAQLLHYLKGLQMFTNISDRQDRPPDEYLIANIEDWMNTLPISKLDSTETMQFENLKKEFTEKVKHIRQEEPDNEQELKNVIRRYLLKFPIEEDMKQDLKFINDKVEQLFKNLLAVPIETSLEHGSDKFVIKAVNNWIKLLPLKQGKRVDDIPRNAIDKLVSVISNLLVKTDVIHIGDIKHTIETEMEKFIKSVPLDPNVNIDFKSLAEELFKAVKEMSRKRSSAAKPPPVKKTADILFDEIESWCDNLPFKGDTSEEIEKIKKIKQEIASKLIHKIGELNMNPEVFSDEFLYDDMLGDEIDNLLTDFSSEDIKNNLPALKKSLIEKVNDARHKTQEEVAGQVYKQQLREVISKTLPTQALTVEEQAAFEVLKENLADAFINLYYVGGDEELKKKYKTKINDEVNKFCNDYLKKHPAEPIDSKKLNHDLFTALKGVPIPKEETVRNEVELVKIKDEVNDWVKDLPLKEQTAAEKMQTNKMVSVLTKKIHDIEKQKALAPDADYDDEMRKEITKWIKKLPLKIDDAEVNVLADKLINNLKNSEKSRRISASTRHSIESDTVELDATPERPKACKPTCKGSCKSQYTMPPSSLSFEDREHLQKIRERGSVSRVRYRPSKDASVNPVPVDAGSQTEIRPWEPCQGGRRLSLQSSGVQTQKPPEQKMLAVSSQAEVSPHVIVREYYWDAFEAAKMQGACGGPCSTQYPNLGFPLGSMSPQMTERPVSQEPSALTTQSPGACPQCPHMSPRSSVLGPYEQTPTPQPRRPRKEWDQSCYRREIPGVSSETNPEPGPSRSFRTPKARVTRLGSFDDMEAKRSRSKHDWAKFPEEDEFWADKPRFVSDEDEEPVLKERKKEEEKSRCRCRERILTKCSIAKRRGHSSCQSNDDVKRCSKCCGAHCPYPSYLFFRQ